MSCSRDLHFPALTHHTRNHSTFPLRDPTQQCRRPCLSGRPPCPIGSNAVEDMTNLDFITSINRMRRRDPFGHTAFLYHGAILINSAQADCLLERDLALSEPSTIVCSLNGQVLIKWGPGSSCRVCENNATGRISEPGG